MINVSKIEESGQRVYLPENTGERIYMIDFTKSERLPKKYSRWQDTVDRMLEGVHPHGGARISLMVDQAFVKAGTTHRRAGVHIDGYWLGHRTPQSTSWQTTPQWGTTPSPPPPWNTEPSRTSPWKTSLADNLTQAVKSEAIILASDVCASRAWVGEWVGIPMAGGDCSHIPLDKLREVRLEANNIYVGNVTMLHESIPVEKDCYRTVVRLHVPGWSLDLLSKIERKKS